MDITWRKSLDEIEGYASNMNDIYLIVERSGEPEENIWFWEVGTDEDSPISAGLVRGLFAAKQAAESAYYEL